MIGSTVHVMNTSCEFCGATDHLDIFADAHDQKVTAYCKNSEACRERRLPPNPLDKESNGEESVPDAEAATGSAAGEA